MSFAYKANVHFPNVQWTGESNIHVSQAKYGVLPASADTWQKVLSLISRGDFGRHIYRYLTGTFTGIEWLVNEEEFVTLFLVDMYRHLRGMKDTQNETKLQNPYTGNVFHRIGLIGNIVTGIRFWVGNQEHDDTGLGLEGGGYEVGYRFRIEHLADDEEEHTRVRAREIVEEANEMIEMVMDSFMEIQEPTKEVLNQLVEFEKQLEIM